MKGSWNVNGFFSALDYGSVGQLEILPNGQIRIEPKVLRHVSDPAAMLERWRFSEEADRASRWLMQSQQQLHEGGLTGPVVS